MPFSTDVRLVIILLLLRLVDAQRFFAIDALLFGVAVFVVLRKAGIAQQCAGKADEEDVLQDLHGSCFLWFNVSLMQMRSIVQPGNQPQVWRWASR